MARFVILHHVCPADYSRATHWDLMLESGDHLRTWALAQRPDVLGETGPSRTITAEELPNHRLAYLEYEGPVSKNRGTVTQWDAGQYELLEASPDTLQIALHGQRLSGSWKLQRTKADEAAADEAAARGAENQLATAANYWLFGRS